MSVRVVVTTGNGPSKTVEFPDMPVAPEDYRLVPKGSSPKRIALPDGRYLSIRITSYKGPKP